MAARLTPHKWTKSDFEAAENYIEAEKSDPFCRQRVYTHMKNGLAGFAFNDADSLIDARYHARAGTERVPYQKPDGTAGDYDRTVYTQRSRP